MPSAHIVSPCATRFGPPFLPCPERDPTAPAPWWVPHLPLHLPWCPYLPRCLHLPRFQHLPPCRTCPTCPTATPALAPAPAPTPTPVPTPTPAPAAAHADCAIPAARGQSRVPRAASAGRLRSRAADVPDEGEPVPDETTATCTDLRF